MPHFTPLGGSTPLALGVYTAIDSAVHRSAKMNPPYD